MFRSMSFLVPALLAALAASPVVAQDIASVHLNTSGKLVYRELPKGDHITDFSYAGYMGGGVSLPLLPVVYTVKPSGADDTAAIQQAIDKVAQLPLHNSVRGTILLASGTFQCSLPLRISASGIVLRGSGSSLQGTTLQLAGKPHAAITITGDEKTEPVGPATHIVQSYVPSGSRSITVQRAGSIHKGDLVRITRVATPEWLSLMGMDQLARNGKPEVWVGHSISSDHVVASRNGNLLTFEVPLTDSYDRHYLPPEGAEVQVVHSHGAIEQSGVEDIRIVAPALKVALTEASFSAIRMSGLHDGWVRNVLVEDTTGGINAGEGTLRITVQDVSFRHSVAIVGAAKPADFGADGSQILFLRCSSTGDDLFYVVTGARNQGPNVVLDSIFRGNGHIQPHQRWSTGILVDSTSVPDGGIDLMNRGEMGSGHGWTMGWGVVWNSSAKSMVIQNPPGAANWSIGNRAEQASAPMPTFGPGPKLPSLPQGIVESPNQSVLPASLYREQLKERLGAAALRALEPS